MSARTVVAMIALVVAVAGAAAAAPAGALDGVASVGQSGAANASNASLGASISAFMQASAADAQGSVDNGMFAAEFNSTEDSQARAGLVTGRAKALEMRVERLRAERAALLDGDGNVTVAERAKAARLASRIESLERAINQTERAAREAGVDVARLDELRSNASKLGGPEVAALATGLVANGNGPPGSVGPPATAGPGGNGQGAETNATEGPLPARNGSDGGGNASDGDRGNASDGDRGNGPPDDRGNGSDTAGDDSTNDGSTATESESTETATE